MIGSESGDDRAIGEGNRKNGRVSLFGPAANNPERETRLQPEFEATARQIYQLVYSRGLFMPSQYKVAEFVI